MTTISKCICKICTCGRHRCPHNRTSIIIEPIKRDCSLTEYTEKFQNSRKHPKRKSLKPPVKQYTPGVSMEIETTYQSNYLTPEPQTRKKHDKKEYVKPNVEMDLVSTYTYNFCGKPGKQSRTFKPQIQYKIHKEKFNGSTIHSLAFKQFKPEDLEWCRSSSIRHKECIDRPTDAFDAFSVMKDDFQSHGSAKRAELIRPKYTKLKGGKFDDTTVYGLEYVPKSPELSKACRTRKYSPSMSPFSSETTANASYQPHPGNHRQLCYKPAQPYSPTKEPFEGNTTMSLTYQEWPAQKPTKPFIAKASKLDPENSEFSKTSSYQDDFVCCENYERPNRTKKQVSEKLILGHPESLASMSTMTNYIENYKNVDSGEKCSSFKVNQSYKPPTEPFNADTNYNSNYKGQFIKPASILTPANKQDATKPKMKFETTYGNTFKGNQIMFCPAKQLLSADENAKNSVFESKGEKNGHYYFRSSSQNSDQNPEKDLPTRQNETIEN